MKRFIVLFCSFALLVLGMKAQMIPSGSSEEQPVWYYIEITDGTTGDLLVCTVEDNQVYGRRTDLTDAIASQLWRFEKDDEGLCYIINKATGYFMNFKFSSTSRTNVACVTSNRAKFKFETENKKVALRLNSATDEACYLGFSTKAGEQIIGITKEESLTNGILKFRAYNDSPLKLSTKGNEVWYSILSAKKGLENLALADNSSENGNYPITANSFSQDDNSQQWKLVKDDATNRIKIVSRKTGLHILTASSVIDNFNATNLGWIAKYPGFEYTYLGLGQYALYGTEDDNIVRYLGLQDIDGTQIDLDTDNLVSSDFAWTFKEIGTGTSVSGINTGTVKITVADGHIIVSGTDEYQITSAQGMIMPKHAKLQKGIYIVTYNGQSTKVTINK